MLKNKVVKVSSPYLIQFFYPDAVIRSELSMLDRDEFVIYTGSSRPQIKKYLEDRTKCYISTVGPAEIDLENKGTLVNFVAESQGRKPTKKVLEAIGEMDQVDVETMCKVFWVCHRWSIDAESSDLSNYNLWEAFVSGKNDFLRVYFDLRKVFPYEVIESSFLTHLVSAITVEEQNKKPGYMELLKKTKSKYGVKLNQIFSLLGVDDSESSFLGTILTVME